MALTTVSPALLDTQAQYTGFKNRIINGDMRIDQRNNGAAKSVPVATSTYVLDRWSVYSVGAGITAQQVASGITGQPYVFQITGAASVVGISTTQKIESKNIADCAGQITTLSLQLSNSLLTTVNWTAYYANTVDNFGAVTTIATGTFNVTNTPTTFTAQISLPANAANGIQFDFSVGAQTSGTWKIGQVQLEKGTAATSFDVIDYGRQLIQCQRYYTVMPIGTLACGFRYTTNLVWCSFPLNTPMRASPTAIGTASITRYDAGQVSSTSSVNSVQEWTAYRPNVYTVFSTSFDPTTNAMFMVYPASVTFSAEL